MQLGAENNNNINNNNKNNNNYYMTNLYRPGVKKFDWFKAGL